MSRVSFGMILRQVGGLKICVARGATSDENKSDSVVNTRAFHPLLLPRNARGSGGDKGSLHGASTGVAHDISLLKLTGATFLLI